MNQTTSIIPQGTSSEEVQKVHTSHTQITSLGDIGSILTATVVTGGNQPVVEMNGIQLSATSTVDTLQSAKAGDQIYLQLSQADDNRIVLKLVDPNAVASSGHRINQTQILKNTQQFVEQLNAMHSQNADASDPETDTPEDTAKQLLQSLTEEERAQLRQMNIEITSANLYIVKGLVGELRTNSRQEELAQQIEVVRDERQPITDNHLIQQIQNSLTKVGIQPESLSGKQAMQSMLDALTQAQTATGSSVHSEGSKRQLDYLIRNEKPLTIENVYTAQYSQQIFSGQEVVAPYTEYQKSSIDEATWDTLKEQVGTVIQTANLPVSEETLSMGRYLLAHELPVTPSSISDCMAFQAMQKNGINVEQVIDNMAELVANGTSPFQARLTSPTIACQAEELSTMVAELQPESIDLLLESGGSLTLQSLYDVSKKADILHSANSLRSITAKRQLAEIQLKMTSEMSSLLIAKDAHINIKELSEVVDSLRQEEAGYYKNQLISHNLTASSDRIDTLQSTSNQLAALPMLPAYSLGALLLGRDAQASSNQTATKLTASVHSITLASLYTQGMQDKAKLAGEAYDTMQTQPRSDLGDSLRKAFSSIDSLLSDLGMETTTANQRAAIILGYNQMELSADNMAIVKDADQQVNQLLDHLQPPVVLELIRSGVNPLSVPIDTLNDLTSQLLGQTDASEENYSKFLYQLEQKKEITTEERASYIGIYRLLDKIARSDGKDLGTVLRNDQPITLANLLTAHKSNLAKGMDTSIDINDSGFEPDSSISAEENTMLGQITQAYASSLHYQQAIAKSLLNRFTPENMEFLQSEDYQKLSLENLDEMLANASSDSNIDWTTWDQELEARFSNTMSTDASQLGSQLLEQFEIPYTLRNLISSNQICRNRGQLYQDYSSFTEVPEDMIEASLTEAFVDSAHMEQAYATLQKHVQDAVTKWENAGSITSRDIQAMQQIQSGMNIMRRMAREEQYQIPITIQNELHVMNLSLQPATDSNEQGQIAASLAHPTLGNLTIDIQVAPSTHSSSSISMQIASDTLESTDTALATLHNAFTSALNGILTNEESEIRTNTLYRMARQLIVTAQQL